jgi:hypothetical protein
LFCGFYSAGNPTGSDSVDYLVVAGGGGGGIHLRFLHLKEIMVEQVQQEVLTTLVVEVVVL